MYTGRSCAIVVKLNWIRRRLSHAIFHSFIQLLPFASTICWLGSQPSSHPASQSVSLHWLNSSAKVQRRNCPRIVQYKMIICTRNLYYPAINLKPLSVRLSLCLSFCLSVSPLLPKINAKLCWYFHLLPSLLLSLTLFRFFFMSFAVPINKIHSIIKCTHNEMPLISALHNPFGLLQFIKNLFKTSAFASYCQLYV